MTDRLAVLGSPIAHSKSPALHRAAYSELGLDWSYDAIEVTGGQLPGFLAGLGSGWRGLSLTMPLKREVMPLLDHRDELAELTGAANTVLIGGNGLSGHNTDVSGIVQAFRQAGVTLVTDVLVLGGGATAASAIVAMAQLGAARVTIALRDPAKGEHLVALAERLGPVARLQSLDSAPPAVDAVLCTIPGGADVQPSLPAASGNSFFDVAYEPWPRPLAAAWAAEGGLVIPGIEMLVNQALIQVRLFLTGDANRELPDEERVLAAMRAAVGLAA
ncbi:shikimate dehydrogenase [soil metagenome]